MKILHVCMSAVVTDGFSYQDNLLPKYHKRIQNDVTVVTSQFVYDKSGSVIKSDRCDYTNEDGVHILRLQTKKKNAKYHDRFKKFIGITAVLQNVAPDVVFIHGVQFMEIPEIVSYLRQHKQITVYVDNHADKTNSGRNFISMHILHKIIWKHMAHKIAPYVKHFYGVLPARVDWLIDVYKLPKTKCSLLVMGADDDEVKRVQSPKARERIRDELQITSEDFLIVTGGKIDKAKTQTLTLMEAIRDFNDPHIKLIVFGPVVSELRTRFDALIKSKNIQYVGWATNSEAYDYFGASDLAVYPGRHSVYWEESVGTGLPMICKYWPGATHVDLGGNVEFLHDDSKEELVRKLKDVIYDKKKYESMKQIATQKGISYFSYFKIAKRSLM